MLVNYYEFCALLVSNGTEAKNMRSSIFWPFLDQPPGEG
jgi:hypothetical protein